MSINNLTASDRASVIRSLDLISAENVRSWLMERQANCLRIAGTKEGSDREGWLEDAAYFAAAIGLIDWTEHQ